MHAPSRLATVALLALPLAVPLQAQAVADSLPRQLSVAQTGCDSLRPPAADSVYESDGVDQQVRARRLDIERMPFRAREVINGRSVLRFIVEPSGRIDGCSMAVLEEDDPMWTDAVVKELRLIRYQPARRGGQPVRQRVYQQFTYHTDGRLLHSR
jgi:hypothetical protein